MMISFHSTFMYTPKSEELRAPIGSALQSHLLLKISSLPYSGHTPPLPFPLRPLPNTKHPTYPVVLLLLASPPPLACFLSDPLPTPPSAGLVGWLISMFAGLASNGSLPFLPG